MQLAISIEEAVDMIPNGASVMLSGFMGVGTPDQLVRALAASGKKNLTLLSNDTARPESGPGPLFKAHCVSKLICSHMGLNPDVQDQFASGELDVELVPQGTFVERIRAAGVGLGGILTPTGVGTDIAEGKEVVTVDGKDYLLEKPLIADFALIAAARCDYVGNLSYMLTATNFNPIMALAGRTVICEAEAIVPVGVISPDEVKTPGVLVDHVIKKSV